MTRRSPAQPFVPALLEALETRSLLSGEIDHTFAANGLATLATDNSAVAVQSDGKIVVAGASPTKSSTVIVTRYLTSGAVDTGFGTKGTFTLTNVNASTINGITVLSGGQILIEGQTYLRLTSAGKLDAKFGGGDGIAGSAQSSTLRQDAANTNAVLSDGSYVELGKVVSGRASLYKYTAAGSVDKSFASGGLFNLASLNTGSASVFRVGGVYRDASNRIYVSYAVGTSASKLSVRVVRLTSAGKIDTTWGTKGITTADASGFDLGNAIAVIADGRVLVVAKKTTTHYTDDLEPFDDSHDKLLVFTNKGVRAADVDLQQHGCVYADRIIPATDGSVYVGGSFVEGVGDRRGEGIAFSAVVRLTKTLAFDTGFSADRDGIAGYQADAVFDGAYSYPTYEGGVAVTPAGDVMVVGNSVAYYGEPVVDGLVRFDGPSKATRVTYSIKNGVLTVNGSSREDQFLLFDADPYNDNTELGFADGSTDLRLDALSSLSPISSADTVPMIQNGGLSGYSTVSKVVATLGDGNDWFYYDDLFSKLPVSVSGGQGNDTIVGGSQADTLRGDAGDDYLNGGPSFLPDNYTGPNNDNLYGGDGNDTLTVDSNYGYHSALFGDAGNDTLSNYGEVYEYSTPGSSYFEGGSGTDTATVNDADNTFSGVEKVIKPA